jgi:hypothetical protein
MMNLVDLIEMGLSSKVNRSFISFTDGKIFSCSHHKRESKVVNLAATMILLVD